MFAKDHLLQRRWVPNSMLVVGGLLLLVSLLFPYWRVDLEAGVYPKGLTLQLRPHRLEGDVVEIDKLNHYIGMRKLETAGELERTIAIPSIVIAALCLFAVPFAPRRWAPWLALPSMVFPIVFLGELYWWLRDSGLHLDPNAPLNQAIKPFIPPIFGEGRIAQFNANASFQAGFFLALLAALLSRIAFYLRKPEWLSKGLIVDAAALLLISLLFPYWRVDFEAKKFPKGLILQIRPHRLEGNIREIDKLNRDIGMREIETAGTFERKVAVPLIVLTALSLLISGLYPAKRTKWLLLPSLMFPLLFVGALYWWLRKSGMNLDAEMALYPDIQPFTPSIVGKSTVGSVTTTTSFQIGFYFSVFTTLIAGVALFLRRWQPPHPTGVKAKAKAKAEAFVLVFLSLGLATVSAETRIVTPEASIAEALAAAADGDFLIVKGGVHEGQLTIDKRVALIGEGAPVIDGGGVGSVITLTAPGASVRGFTIRNTGDSISEGDAGIMIKQAKGAVIEENRFEAVLFGVQVRNSPETVVRNNSFRGKALDLGRRGDLIRVWYSSGAVVEDNQVSDGRDVVIWYSKQVTVRGNEVRNGRYGIHFMYCDDATISENRLVGNSVGVYLMYSYRLVLERNWIVSNRGASGYGIGLKDMYDGRISDNLTADNRVGVFMDNATNVFQGNVIACNDFGLTVLPSARKNRFEENSFVDNGEQVSIEGQGSLGSNRWQHNYWSDYSGYDADGDGVGDIAYRSMRLFEQLTAQHPTLRLFVYSPSAQALDFASRLFPIFAPQPKLTDDAPRMSPTTLRLVPPHKRASLAWAVGSTALLLSGLFFRRAGLKTCHRGTEAQRRKLETRRRRGSGGGEDKKTRDTSREFSSFSRFHRHSSAVLSRFLVFPFSRLRPSYRSKSEIRNRRQPAATESAIAVDNLTKRFGKATAVDNLSFVVDKGQTVALWGPNGAGKTTALRCVLGVLPFEGNVTVWGNSARAEGKLARSAVGYVPQEVRLHSDLTVKETVAFYARLRGASAERVNALMDEWQLREMAEKQIGSLSGGMKQRLALAIALLSDPPILLLDEPTSNLDAHTRYEFWRALERLKAAGKTLIFCSHRLDEVFRLADHVIVMENGRKVAEGHPRSLNGHLTTDLLLHLTIPEAYHATAADLLEGRGFSVHRHGTKFSIPVKPHEKADTLRVLMKADVPVDDFELSADRGGANQ